MGCRWTGQNPSTVEALLSELRRYVLFEVDKETYSVNAVLDIDKIQGSKVNFLQLFTELFHKNYSSLIRINLVEHTSILVILKHI